MCSDKGPWQDQEIMKETDFRMYFGHYEIDNFGLRWIFISFSDKAYCIILKIGHAVTLEIQATIPSGPEKLSRVGMWKSAMGPYFVNGLCYFRVAIIGYWVFGEDVTGTVDRAGYKTPSPIHTAAIPLGLQQRDVIGVAEIDSGKTAAFVLHMLTYITRNEAEIPYAVVLAPTRELGQQIVEETGKFAHYLGIKVVSVVGGQSIEEQGFKIRKGCEPQVVGVLEAMPSSNFKPENEDEELDEKRIYRTTYMFSATMPTAVERLARKYLRNPVVVTIGTAGKTTDLITQDLIMVKESEKMPWLQKMLDDLGDKTAIQSEVSLDGFRTKRFYVLVATDVAGRGIDIPDVAHVGFEDHSSCEVFKVWCLIAFVSSPNKDVLDKSSCSHVTNTHFTDLGKFQC
ncbi:P-loop containing nucleoside triphosphate hydrolases superfamily protein [Artemisia annua]|uniref:RNA helicase n=1 Tax=Artemisia annua TaxID=35608 RepID=A0A2U1L970_ARTAN|nr:P-loop containing nucleoside triphosphate hydrolases superfamily protein [Artemisia annua]